MNKEMTMKKESMTTKVGGFLNRNSMYIALALVCAMCMGSTVFAVDALINPKMFPVCNPKRKRLKL